MIGSVAAADADDGGVSFGDELLASVNRKMRPKNMKPFAGCVDHLQFNAAEPNLEDKATVPSKKSRKVSKETVQSNPDEDDIIAEDDDDSDVTEYPKLRSRACPILLFQAIEKFSSGQRETVIDMGFRHILHMKVNKVPTQLAYWVLDNFDANSSELRLANGRSILVDADDAHLVFRFPKGGRKIQRRKKSDVLDSERKFYNQFGDIKRDRIKLKLVYDKMMDDVGGGEVFRMDFLVLLTACLIESNINGYAAAPMLRYMDGESLKSIHELDWCEYVVASLIHHKRMWEANKANSFGGPILFLTAICLHLVQAMYVDRVISHGKQLVDRSFPTVKGWTFNLIRKREKQEMMAGGFGGGRLCPQYKKTDEELAQFTADEERRKRDGRNDVQEDEMQKFANEFLAKSKLMADTMMQLVMLIERAPKHLWENPRFKKIVEAGQHLVRCKVGIPSTPDNTRPTQFYEQDEDDEIFWSNPSCIVALEEIEKAIIKRDEWKKHIFEGPSFSLGLSQDWDDVVNISREVVDMPHEGPEADSHVDPHQEVTSDAPVRPMVKRKAAILKKNEAFTSPYHERMVDGSGELNKQDKELYYWLTEGGLHIQEHKFKKRGIADIVYKCMDKHTCHRCVEHYPKWQRRSQEEDRSLSVLCNNRCMCKNVYFIPKF
ncbi:hypothetical protein C2S51_002099 [Perilla frutescens var. frutescens]|nr:hypothetical protein C2S51_002099 [Perilla frutescens var. frutescens]